MRKILLITPPFTQLNTPYPATAYLKGFLDAKGFETAQADLGIDVVLELFSSKGLAAAFEYAKEKSHDMSPNSERVISLNGEYISTIDSVIAFLQGKNQTLARRISSSGFLPQASRFDNIYESETAFGTMGLHDKAKFRATLYLEDLSDFIIECVDADFGFSRYAERLGRSANSFDEINSRLQQHPTFIDTFLLGLLEGLMQKHKPDFVCFSVPFPGNLYSAFRCAKYLKENYANVKLIMGGGFPNTELRSLSDNRVFGFFDYITLDDGELPLELIFESENENNHRTNTKQLKRTFFSENGNVVYLDNSNKPDYRQNELPAPDYSGLDLNRYISVIEIPNPMHTLWSNGCWLKLSMAHGCYWKQCTFCDVSLPYIKDFDPVDVSVLVDKMERMMEQTGQSGFHFVDEAAPPALMGRLAAEIIKRKLAVTWWTNIRFENNFSADLCKLLYESGCIAVSGGLEVASDRLLKLINKGVSVEQVARVARNFNDAGILVHAYLMYGFPSQTVQETIDSLEMVRQMFEAGILKSAYWHRFALTAHSPVGLNPEKFGIDVLRPAVSFAENDLVFTDKTGIDHGGFSFGLKKSLYNYMHGQCFDLNLQTWFDFKIPPTKVPKGFIVSAVQKTTEFDIKPGSRVFWLGQLPVAFDEVKTKKGKTFHNLRFEIQHKTNRVDISFEKDAGYWLLGILAKVSIHSNHKVLFGELKDDYETTFSNFELFWFSKPVQKLRECGLLLI